MPRQNSEMLRFSARFSARLVALVICALCLYNGESTSISLSPLGMVTVCPEGQVLLTCKMVSGSILQLVWNVSVPHLAGTTSQRIIVPASPGIVLSPDFKIGVTEFNVTRTSDRPLISQLLINKVTTRINGSTIYCSEDDNDNNPPITTVNVKYKDEYSLNVIFVVNQLLRSDDVTVTLQWPREPGAIYRVSVSPEIHYTKLTNAMTIMINLTVSYDTQYNVSIVSSLCGVTTTKVLNYVTCNYPPIQLNHPVVVVSGSQNSPPIEGQFITYTCPPGLVLTGPSTSECVGNREWEPDPGQVDCIADCGLPLSLVDRNVMLNYSSTLEGSVLTLTCENEIFFNFTEMTLSVTCDSNGSWIPNPADFIQSCSLFSTTASPTTDSETLLWTPVSIAVCVIISILLLSIGYACGWFSQKHKQSRTRKATSDSSVTVEENTGPNEGSQLPPTPGPLYEELQQRSAPEHQDLVELKENVAYGPIVK